MYKIRKELEPALRHANLKTREELIVLLADLDEAMPRLIAQNPDGADFMPLFADRADAIAIQADVLDHQWLMDRIDSLLEKNGKQDDEYLPPHHSLFV